MSALVRNPWTTVAGFAVFTIACAVGYVIACRSVK